MKSRRLQCQASNTDLDPLLDMVDYRRIKRSNSYKSLLAARLDSEDLVKYNASAYGILEVIAFAVPRS